MPTPPFSQFQVEWRQSPFYDRFASGRLAVTFDPRGTGLSDRDVSSYQLNARLMDIDAVVAAAGLERFALYAIWHSGAVAIAYAARHPERISHLILDDSFADARAVARTPQSRAFGELADDWEALTENIAFSFSGSGGDEGQRYAEFLRACTTRDDARRMWAAFVTVNVTDMLPEVRAPTLILQHAGMRILTDHAREMAARIPNAHLVMLDGKEGDDLDHLLTALAGFLGEEPSEAARTPPVRSSGVRSILFTDIERNTELLQRLGDEAWRAVLREHERITRDVLKAHGGTEVKHLGDGFMASFDSAANAVDCALHLQPAFDTGMGEAVRVRAGINAGEPIAEDDDLFGTAVTVAARITGQARGAEVLVSEVVRALVAGKGFNFVDRGAVSLKGFEEPIRIYEVRGRAR